jgi:hypothetical protein
MIVFLIVLNVVQLLLLGVSFYYLYKFSRFILDLEDQTEDSLDILNECYAKLLKISKLDIMLDEPVVREMVQTLMKSIDAILIVANMIASPFDAKKERASEQSEI